MAEPPQEPWTIEFHVTPTGERPARAFLESLTGQNRTVALALIELLEKWGNRLREPKSALVGDKLFELRNPPNPVRIFYVFRAGRRAVLLDGMVKKRQRIPRDVLARVQAYQRQAEALEAKQRGGA
jgi:phage-related protein